MKRAFCVAIVLAFFACGAKNVLDEGEVVGKSYDDPDSWWTSMCVAYHKDGWCQVSIPVQQTDDAHWFIDIIGYDDEGKQREETHEVTQTLYEMAQNGLTVRLSDQSIVPK